MYWASSVRTSKLGPTNRSRLLRAWIVAPRLPPATHESLLARRHSHALLVNDTARLGSLRRLPQTSHAGSTRRLAPPRRAAGSHMARSIPKPPPPPHWFLSVTLPLMLPPAPSICGDQSLTLHALTLT